MLVLHIPYSVILGYEPVHNLTSWGVCEHSGTTVGLGSIYGSRTDFYKLIGEPIDFDCLHMGLRALKFQPTEERAISSLVW